jgi:[acyl-carrier-protein] S-malonyltransferase
MQAAVPAGQGAMAAIVGLSDEAVQALCDKAAQGEILIPANYNAIGQVVLAGTATAVERAVVMAKEAGAKLAKLLPVSVPSHCELMKPAALKLAQALEKVDLQAPKISVLHNVDVRAHTQADAIRSALVQQLYSPVRWVETVQAIALQGITQAIECGPGKVLAGLGKRIEKNIDVFSIGEPDVFKTALLS